MSDPDMVPWLVWTWTAPINPQNPAPTNVQNDSKVFVSPPYGRMLRQIAIAI
jgi:hypothetical protein